MKEGSSPSVVEVQHQIRANASQLQDYFSDLYAWEKSIGKEDSARKRAAKAVKKLSADATPPPRTARVVGVGNKRSLSGASAASENKLDAHTYDKGYKRWEKFDVDAALKEADEDEGSKHKNLMESLPAPVAASEGLLTTKVTTKSREELEKDEGNAHYKRGDYVAAIKSYTRCLGYNPQNAVVLSNRAMAYLKNREFANAEDDCTLALKADPTHVKSYSRRGTARNSLGKHRLALIDFHRAATLDPKSRQIQTQLQLTRELVRTAIKRSPKRTEFTIEVSGENSSSKQLGPEQSSNTSENKENVEVQQQAQPPLDTKHKTSPLQESGTATLAPSSQSAMKSVPEKKQKNKSSAILPKLPKKAPTTSYEFGRVWRTLVLRGDAEQKYLLRNLRLDYLRMIDPPTLPSIFKTGMESDALCEIFHVLRHAMQSNEDSAGRNDNIPLAFSFSSELTKVPRFNMTIMLLSDREKADMVWVITRLEASLEDESQKREVANLKKLYELP